MRRRKLRSFAQEAVRRMLKCLSGIERARSRSTNRYRWLLASLILAITVSAGCGKFFPDATDLVSISVTPSSSSLQLTKTQQFTALGTFGDGTSRDISSSATWSSSSSNVASISNTGLATALQTGTTTITASQSGKSGSTILTVTTGGGGGLTISCSGCTGQGSSTFTAAAGSTLTFTATNSSNQTVSATWSSSNTTVANIGSVTGIAANVTVGTTTITANANGTTGSVTLTVQ